MTEPTDATTPGPDGVANVRRPRRSPRGERRRDHILTAAAIEFAERGYVGASLSTIAEASGITQSGLLHHYPTKERLLEAVIDHQMVDDAQYVDDPPAGEVAPLRGLHTLLRHHGEHELGARLNAILAAEGLTTNHPAQAPIRRRYERVREHLAGRIQQQREVGLVPDSVETETLSVLVIAALDGLLLQWLYDSEIDMEASLDLLLALVEASALTESAARRISSSGDGAVSSERAT